MIRKILTLPKDNDYLRVHSLLAKRNEKTKNIIRDLKDTLLSTRNGIGLSAPQIREYRRIIVVKLGESENDIITIINPVVVTQGRLYKGFDGCLSIPDLYTWETKRPNWIRIKGLTEGFTRFENTFFDLHARLVHHELDHLNGVLFIDRMSDGDIMMKKVGGEMIMVG